MSNNKITIGNEWLSFNDVKNFIVNRTAIDISKDAEMLVVKCRKFLDDKMNENERLYYGINTGFGFLQNVKIDNEQIEQLQYNLLMSHACGMGNEVPAAIVRLMLLLKIKSLSFGNSGVQLETINGLATLCNKNILPVVFTQGSLGASGDLAPLSHLTLPLIGMGEVLINNEKKLVENCLHELGFTPIALKSKEGLALINGTQFMSAYGMYCLYKAEHLLQMADLIAALSFDAFDCVREPLHPSIHEVRKHNGQINTATNLRNILADSEIGKQPKKHVQDPYSFRCIPQVHGASKDVYNNVLNVFLTEINAVTDNPNVFPDEDLIISAGNFHGQPLALTLDFLCLALAELGSISERRTFQLISGTRGLPPFLVKDAGLNSGLMITQYTAASIASENKQLCTPASVDSIVSSNGQEDHVSMGANAATKCLRVCDNLERILAIELLTASQALELRLPEKSSDKIRNLVSEYRKVVSFNEADRILSTDIKASVEFMKSNILN